MAGEVLRQSAILGWAAEHFGGDSRNLAGMFFTQLCTETKCSFELDIVNKNSHNMQLVTISVKHNISACISLLSCAFLATCV